jgi:hypothetical protein
MKLKLRAENDIQILTISELNSSKSVDVLRAGVTQLLRNGKNRIVLELTEAKSVPAELLRELGRLKLLANELAGDIVLSGLDPETKQKIDLFAKPPFAISFLSTAQAIKYFKDSAAPEKTKPSAAATPAAAPVPVPVPVPTPAPSAAPHGTAAGTSAEQFKEEIRQREMGELGQLRKQIEQLKKENQSLTQLLTQKLFALREPQDVAGYKKKIQELETQLASFVSEPAPKTK